MTTYGSTEKEMKIDKSMVQARETAIKTATVQGVSIELQTQKQHLNTLNDKIDGVYNLIRTMQQQFDLFQQQRGIELSNMVNHGPTASPD